MGADVVRVFVIEDQAPLRTAIIRALAQYPELEVVGSAATGEDGLAQLKTLSAHVLLLDLELPDTDGIDVTRRLKARGSELAVLILTSFDDEQKVYQAVQAGASGYLVKRVGPDKIRDAIHEVLSGGVVIEPLIAKRFWNYFNSVAAKPATATNPWHLSPAELDVLRFVAKGLSNAEVGRVMALERRTVRTHLANLYKKMGVASHVDAVVAALKAGVIEL